MTGAGWAWFALVSVLAQWLALGLAWWFVQIVRRMAARHHEEDRQRVAHHEQAQFLYREFVRLHGEQVQMLRDLQRLKGSA